MRAFVALPLAPAVREELARATSLLRALSWADPVRWVPAGNLHLTLRFLGDAAEASIPRLLAALRARLASLDSFCCELDGLFLFPSASHPRVVAVRVSAEPHLLELARCVEAAVVGAGFEKESRRFRAHVTLGRFRRPDRRRREFDAELAALRLEVREVVLYRSVPAQRGTRYSELGRAALAPRPGHGRETVEECP